MTWVKFNIYKGRVDISAGIIPKTGYMCENTVFFCLFLVTQMCLKWKENNASNAHKKTNIKLLQVSILLNFIIGHAMNACQRTLLEYQISCCLRRENHAENNVSCICGSLLKHFKSCAQTMATNKWKCKWKGRNFLSWWCGWDFGSWWGLRGCVMRWYGGVL